MVAQVLEELGQIPMSPHLVATLGRATDYARQQNHRIVTLEHLLLALTEDQDASTVLRSSNIDLGQLTTEVSSHLGRLDDRVDSPDAAAQSISDELRRILEAAAAAAQQGRRADINGAIVLAAIVGDAKSTAASILRTLGLSFEQAIRALQQAAAETPQAPPQAPTPASPPDPKPAPPVAGSGATKSAEPVPHVSAPPVHRGPAAWTPPSDDQAPAQDRSEETRPTGPPPQNPQPAPISLDPGNAAQHTRAPQPDAAPKLERTFGHPSQRPTTAPGASRGVQPPGAPYPSPEGHPQQPPAPARPAPQQPAPTQPSPPQPAPAPQAPISRQSPTTGPGAAPARRSRTAPPQQPPGGRSASGPFVGPWPLIEAGQLVENIPRHMRMGIPVVVEARIARAQVKALAEGLQGGGAAYHHEVIVTKAMAVRLRGSDGSFMIEPRSPETQWIDNILGMAAEDYASWRWTVTPKLRGKRKLQLVVSARTVGADGLTAETALPDQWIDVKVGINYGATAKRVLGWTTIAIIGGVFGHFGETALEQAKIIIAKLMAGS